MATITLRPTSGTGNNWTDIANVYDGNQSTSGSVSTSRLNYTSRTLVLNFDTSVIPLGATINSATLTIRCQGGKNTITAYVDINENSSNRVINSKQSTSAANYTADVTSYMSNLTSVEVTAYNSNWSGNTFIVYELWIDVDYTADTTYTVTFKDWDGSTINTQTVPSGGNATPPPYPARDGYLCIGWDNYSFTNITSNLDITAQYVQEQGTSSNNRLPLFSKWYSYTPTDGYINLIQAKDYSMSIYAGANAGFSYQLEDEYRDKNIVISVGNMSYNSYIYLWNITDSTNVDFGDGNIGLFYNDFVNGATSFSFNIPNDGKVYELCFQRLVTDGLAWITDVQLTSDDFSSGEVDTSVKNIKIGSSTIDKLYLGTSQILKAYLGSILLYSYSTGGTGGGDTPVIGNNYQLYTGYPLIVENSSLDANYGSYITEIVGNTTQSSTDLTDIRSVGVLQGDGTYKVDIIASNQNGSQTQTKSIYLPQPLRMVRGYSDRLYWDDTLGKYCIEQNVAIFKMSEFQGNINNQGDDLELCVGYVHLPGTNIDTTYCDFCNILPSYRINWSFPNEGIYYEGGGVMFIAVSRDKANNMTELKQWCIDNNFTCYVKYKNAVIVETDITDKILFNTYANYTKVITDEKEVAPISMSGNFASSNL